MSIHEEYKPFYVAGARDIKALKVKCSSLVNGCLWVGELGSLDAHTFSHVTMPSCPVLTSVYGHELTSRTNSIFCLTVFTIIIFSFSYLDHNDQVICTVAHGVIKR